MANADDDRLQILIVDDEASSREALSFAADVLGHSCDLADGGVAAQRAAEGKVYDLALVDLRLGSESGIEVAAALMDESPWLKVAVVTSHGSIRSAVEAIKGGAVDYLEKPVTRDEFERVLRRVSKLRALERDAEQLREDLESAVPPVRLSTEDPTMREVYATARRAAESDATVLIRGESGTGKGVLARAIHDWSPRSAKPFSVINTPTLPSELFESELFGHVKGAFTGAVKSRRGRLARAEGGTLLIDEIGTMPIALQPKLLRLLQERAYERVGGDDTRVADVRMIVATNQDLEEAVAEGDFREDLYFRIRVIEIEVPPLRDRPVDILPLAEQFTEFFGARYGRGSIRLSDAARRELRDRSWPGNVRELQNAIERAVILSPSAEIPARALPPAGETQPATVGDTPMITLEEMERRHIARVLEATTSVEAAADVLGVSTTTLWRRRKKHDL